MVRASVENGFTPSQAMMSGPGTPPRQSLVANRERSAREVAAAKGNALLNTGQRERGSPCCCPIGPRAALENSRHVNVDFRGSMGLCP